MDRVPTVDFLTLEVLSALFRRLFLQMLFATHEAGRLQFFGDLLPLGEKPAFTTYLKPLRNIDGSRMQTKRPFAGPKQMLRYLSRYTRPGDRPMHLVLREAIDVPMIGKAKAPPEQIERGLAE